MQTSRTFQQENVEFAPLFCDFGSEFQAMKLKMTENFLKGSALEEAATALNPEDRKRFLTEKEGRLRGDLERE